MEQVVAVVRLPWVETRHRRMREAEVLEQRGRTARERHFNWQVAVVAVLTVKPQARGLMVVVMVSLVEMD